jgi:hypothetical protein
MDRDKYHNNYYTRIIFSKYFGAEFDSSYYLKKYIKTTYLVGYTRYQIRSLSLNYIRCLKQ